MKTISLIIPIYNAEKFLKTALDSVFIQTPLPDQILIIDDGSTDGSLQLAKNLALQHPEIEVYSQPNSGPAHARNTALKHATGDWIAFLDADDEFPPNTFELMCLEMEKAEASMGREAIVRGLVQLLARSGHDSWIPFCAPYSTPQLGAGFYPRSAFEQIGYFNANLTASEDVDWLLRAGEAGIPCVMIEATTILYRRHDTNMTAGKNLKQLELHRVLKLSLDRRRASKNSPAT